ncbi:rRNA methyltransferase 1, mitochondrial-like [Macrobrachium rosenbergii]|uniref:rRNA methyltransferase 1, mitochondrial-like n=1 Tax=Macrobrachium rosenbergii TaxID=79674 RepID=UPI0034D3BD48
MFSRLIVRYASKKRFSLPSVNFKYAEKDVQNEEEKRLPPVYPIEEERHERTGVKSRFKKEKSNGKSNEESSGISASRNLIGEKKVNNNKIRKNVKFEGKYKSFSTAVKRKTGVGFEPEGELIFGIHPVFHALQAQRRKFNHLYYKAGLEDKNVKIQEILKLAGDNHVQAEAVKLSQLTKIIGEDRVHQGICCDVSPLPFEKLEVDSSNINENEESCKLWLYMDRIQDPMNFGAILRSAYFMGVDKVITSKENSCRLTGIVSKASAGAAEMLPVYQADDLRGLLQVLVNQEWNLLCAAPESPSSIPLNTYMPNGNTVVAVGNEGYGISPELRDLFKTTIAIQPGRVLRTGMDSLNVSVATAVILHDITSKISAINTKNSAKG